MAGIGEAEKLAAIIDQAAGNDHPPVLPTSADIPKSAPGGGDQIRLEPHGLAGKPLSGTAITGDDLIRDKQNIVLFAMA